MLGCSYTAHSFLKLSCTDKQRLFPICHFLSVTGDNTDQGKVCSTCQTAAWCARCQSCVQPSCMPPQLWSRHCTHKDHSPQLQGRAAGQTGSLVMGHNNTRSIRLSHILFSRFHWCLGAEWTSRWVWECPVLFQSEHLTPPTGCAHRPHCSR